jgi:hypothetical protein
MKSNLVYISQYDKKLGYARMMSTDLKNFNIACYTIELTGSGSKRKSNNLYSARLTEKQRTDSYSIPHAVHCKNGDMPGCYDSIMEELLKG